MRRRNFIAGVISTAALAGVAAQPAAGGGSPYSVPPNRRP
jgi:hypothetical protein